MDLDFAFTLPVAETVPFIVWDKRADEQSSWELPIEIVELSPLWSGQRHQLDQLPITVLCSVPTFQAFLQVAQYQSWVQCPEAEQDAVQYLAQCHQVRLPALDYTPEILQLQPQSNEQDTDCDQVIESLYEADDFLLQVYADHTNPIISAGAQALRMAKKIETCAKECDPATLTSALSDLFSALTQPLHPLLERRLALLAEQMYLLPERSQPFFFILGGLF